MADLSRENYLSSAKLSEELEDYSKMMDYMRDLVYSIDGAELTLEERKTFLAGAKSLVDFHRKRVVEIELEVLEANTDTERAIIRYYLLHLYAGFESACKSIITTTSMLIRSHWELRRKLNDSTDDKYLEPLIMYYIQEGDCYRYIYISEVKRDVHRGVKRDVHDDLKENVERARSSYQFAWENAKQLATLDVERIPFMLEVGLSFSVLCFKILSSPKECCDIAKEALNKATPNLHKISSTSSLDACNRLIATLKNNLQAISPMSGVEKNKDKIQKNKHKDKVQKKKLDGAKKESLWSSALILLRNVWRDFVSLDRQYIQIPEEQAQV